MLYTSETLEFIVVKLQEWLKTHVQLLVKATNNWNEMKTKSNEITKH